MGDGTTHQPRTRHRPGASAAPAECRTSASGSTWSYAPGPRKPVAKSPAQNRHRDAPPSYPAVVVASAVSTQVTQQDGIRQMMEWTHGLSSQPVGHVETQSVTWSGTPRVQWRSWPVGPNCCSAGAADRWHDFAGRPGISRHGRREDGKRCAETRKVKRDAPGRGLVPEPTAADDALWGDRTRLPLSQPSATGAWEMPRWSRPFCFGGARRAQPVGARASWSAQQDTYCRGASRVGLPGSDINHWDSCGRARRERTEG